MLHYVDLTRLVPKEDRGVQWYTFCGIIEDGVNTTSLINKIQCLKCKETIREALI
jgi:hypothetical protein